MSCPDHPRPVHPPSSFSFFDTSLWPAALAAPMYPYESKLRWWIKPRYKHLIDAVERQPSLLEGRLGAQLDRRLTRMNVWLKVRLALLIFLSFSLVASAASVILSWFPGTTLAEDALRVFIRVATTFATLFTVLYFFTLRTLGQLEIDALMMIHVHHLRH